MSGPVILELPGVAPIVVTSELVPHLEAALREHRRITGDTRDLASEIEAFLGQHPAASTLEIARGIKARDKHVRDTLVTDPRFRSAAPMPGRSGRAKRWDPADDACEPVPTHGTSTSEGAGRSR